MKIEKGESELIKMLLMAGGALLVGYFWFQILKSVFELGEAFGKQMAA